MSLNRKTGGRAERILRQVLRQHKIRFRTRVQSLPGVPDLVLPTERVCVFCDGDFWHGRNWTRLREQLGTRANPDYWQAKIASNRTRDRRIRARLRRMGWCVLRVWETDLLRDTDGEAAKLLARLRG